MEFQGQTFSDDFVGKVADMIGNLIGKETIRKAYEGGDRHLNTIPLRKWDSMAAVISVKGFSLSQKVWLLKTIARDSFVTGGKTKQL